MKNICSRKYNKKNKSFDFHNFLNINKVSVRKDADKRLCLQSFQEFYKEHKIYLWSNNIKCYRL